MVGLASWSSDIDNLFVNKVRILSLEPVKQTRIKHTAIAAEGITWAFSTAGSSHSTICANPFAIGEVEMRITAVC